MCNVKIKDRLLAPVAADYRSFRLGAANWTGLGWQCMQLRPSVGTWYWYNVVITYLGIARHGNACVKKAVILLS